jgi:tRNA A37 threonylcarbamoyladenosine dehydratase
MGAGNKLDPARLETTDIYATSVCPLAKVMRRELRKRGVESLPVVYSREEPVKPGHGRESGGPDISCSQETARLEIKCRQVPGSISFVPSVAGLIMAGYVVRDLIKGI